MRRTRAARTLLVQEEPSLRLRRGVPALSAVLRDARTVVCGRLQVISDTPIVALCEALVAAGLPNCAIQVRRPGGEPVCFIQSFHQDGTGRQS